MTAPNDDGPIAAGLQGTTETTSPAIVPCVERERKDDATLIAVGAMHGFQLRKLDGGAWLISRWNLWKEVPTAAAAAEFLRLAGVAS